MIRFIYGYDLLLEPELAKSMFRDRATQFSERLGWDVQVDRNGLERDVYDTLNPLYIIVTDDLGRHLGSMRFLPTLGRTMLNDFFQNIYDGPEIRKPSAWECTRFCLAPGAHPRTSIKLLAAGGRLMREFGLQELVAVFDDRMKRVYRRSGVAPETLGSGLYKGAQVTIGHWRYSAALYTELLSAARIEPIEMELYLANSYIAQDMNQYA